MGIIKKYESRAEKADSLLCVGLDSDFEKLPGRFKKLPNQQFEFNKWIIDETHEYVAAYKPNAAFYEARGDVGLRELKMTMEYLQTEHPDIFTILDAKRADIGNTNNGYVTAIFDWLGFDAVTLHPYLGREALAPFLDRKDKVSVILCRTSNEGAGEFQDLKLLPYMEAISPEPLWKMVAEKVANEWNENGNCMLVVGATYPEEMKIIRASTGDMTFLVPGIGAQGGSVSEVLKNGKNSERKGLIISASRSIIFSNNPRESAKALRDEIQSYQL